MDEWEIDSNLRRANVRYNSKKNAGLSWESFKEECDHCGHWYPKGSKRCPKCKSANLDWYTLRLRQRPNMKVTFDD